MMGDSIWGCTVPHIEGIEIPKYERYEPGKKKRSKEERQATRLRWYHNTRSLALATLGSKCGCGETDPANLHIIALTNEAKEWSQLLFYKRLIDAFRSGDDPTRLGRIICRKCRYGMMSAEAASRRKGTGIFYWIAGERVEQLKDRIQATEKEFDGTRIQFNSEEHEDLGVEELEREAENELGG